MKLVLALRSRSPMGAVQKFRGGKIALIWVVGKQKSALLKRADCAGGRVKGERRATETPAKTVVTRDMTVAYIRSAVYDDGAIVCLIVEAGF